MSRRKCAFYSSTAQQSLHQKHSGTHMRRFSWQMTELFLKCNIWRTWKPVWNTPLNWSLTWWNRMFHSNMQIWPKEDTNSPIWSLKNSKHYITFMFSLSVFSAFFNNEIVLTHRLSTNIAKISITDKNIVFVINSSRVRHVLMDIKKQIWF